MNMMMRFTFLAIFIMVPNVLYANPPLLGISDEIEPHLCIPESEFYVSGIKPGDSLENVLAKFGEPMSIEGSMDFPTYYYPNITIFLCNGVSVGSLLFDNSKIETQSGIRLGMNRADIYSILGIQYYQGDTGNQSLLLKQQDIESEVVSFPNCSDIFSFIQFKFSNSDILEEISIGYDCP